MPLQRGGLVLVDTNVIIAAHDSGCLPQLLHEFRVCTVEEVIVETQRGSQRRAPERNIDATWLRQRLAQIGAVTDEQRVEFTLTYQSPGLDDGERDLLIWAATIEDAWLLNSPDMAVLRFANQVNWLDRLVSLDSMCRTISARLTQNLPENFRDDWLMRKRTEFMLGIL